MIHQNTRQPSRMSLQDLGEEHRSYLEEALFDAIVAAGVIVALADGNADDAERSVLADFVDQSPWVSTFTSAEASDAFDSCARQFQATSHVPEALEAALRRAGRRGSGIEVLCAAQKVALADGTLEAAEEAALNHTRLTVTPPLTKAVPPAQD